MSNVYLDFLNSNQIAELGTEVWAVYFCLLCDVVEGDTATAKARRFGGKLISGYSVQSCAQKTGLVNLTVMRHIETLRKKRWLTTMRFGTTDYFCLGDIVDGNLRLYASVEKHEKIVSVKHDIMRMAREALDRKTDKAIATGIPKLSDEIKSKFLTETFGGLAIKRSPKTQVLDIFYSAYQDKYKDSPAICVRGKADSSRKLRYDTKAYVYAGRLLDAVDNNAEAAKRLILFMFERWDDYARGKKFGRLEMNMFGANIMLKNFSDYYVAHKGTRHTEAAVTKPATSSSEKPIVGWD